MEGMPTPRQLVLKTRIQCNSWGMDTSTFRKYWNRPRAGGWTVNPELEASSASYSTQVPITVQRLVCKTSEDSSTLSRNSKGRLHER